MGSQPINIKCNASGNELSLREKFFSLYKKCPIPDNELLSNLGLFIKRQDLSGMLFMIQLYEKILGIHGIIVEFGVRWGRNLALFESLRGIYEPFNHNRKIVGFDSFEGFPSIHEKDGESEIIAEGSYSVSEGYEDYLRQILDYHEQESPISHIRKYRLIKGDATEEIVSYLEKNPETIIALAYFDFDIYEPTRRCLEAIRKHLTRGSIIGFDQLNEHDYPGETIALREVLGTDRYQIRRTPYSGLQSYIIIE